MLARLSTVYQLLSYLEEMERREPNQSAKRIGYYCYGLRRLTRAREFHGRFVSSASELAPVEAVRPGGPDAGGRR